MSWKRFTHTLFDLNVYPRLLNIHSGILAHWVYRMCLRTGGKDIPRLNPDEEHFSHLLMPENEFGLVTSNLAVDMVTALLYLAKCKDATKPEDKVFAIHGCLRYLDVVLPPPDYKNLIDKIYREMAVAVLLHDKSLIVLNLASGVVGNIQRLAELPSWVPDWSIRSETWIPSPGFKAAGRAEAKFRLSDELNQLSVLGNFIDVINSTVDGQGRYLVEMAETGAVS